MSRINFQRQQENLVDKSSFELIRDFFYFLQGKCPETISCNNIPNLHNEQASSVIYYLQEHLPVLPDTIEKCDKCGKLFDLFHSGIHCEICGNLCEDCENLCGREDV